MPIRVSFGAKNPTDLLVEEVLLQPKVLKDSLKFNVFFNKEMALTQIVQLKKLIRTRNDENEKLNAMHMQAKTKVNYRYGIRNEMVVKVNLIKT